MWPLKPSNDVFWPELPDWVTSDWSGAQLGLSRESAFVRIGTWVDPASVIHGWWGGETVLRLSDGQVVCGGNTNTGGRVPDLGNYRYVILGDMLFRTVGRFTGNYLANQEPPPNPRAATSPPPFDM